MSTATTTVCVESDPARVLGLLKAAFSQPTTVLAELLQNGRRAGATRIDITVTAADVVIEDDGTGIEDFSVLLAIAKSGWKAETMATEAPYGAGFCSCFFACDWLVVESRGNRLSAATETLLAVKPVEIQPCARRDSTQIALGYHRLGTVASVVAAIGKLVTGFPIPVFVNGAPCDRPHAIGNDTFFPSEIGQVSSAVRRGSRVTHWYLQGLPISVSGAGDGFRGFFDGEDHAAARIVHLDSRTFLGRMPDRAALLDPESAGARIGAGLHKVVSEHVTERASALSAAAFVHTYGDLAARLGMRELMNAFDCIPGRWVSRYVYLPTVAHHTDSLSVPDQNVTRAEMEASGVYDVSLEAADYTDDLRAAVAVHASGAYVNQAIPDWHWAAALCRSLEPESFAVVTGDVLGEEMLTTTYFDCTLRVATTLQLQEVDAAGATVGDPIAISCCYDAVNDVLYGTPEATPSDAVGQVSAFTDDDRYDENEASEAADQFNTLRASIVNNDPVALLRDLITAQGLPTITPAALRGQRFIVRFSRNGKLTVSSA